MQQRSSSTGWYATEGRGIDLPTIAVLPLDYFEDLGFKYDFKRLHTSSNRTGGPKRRWRPPAMSAFTVAAVPTAPAAIRR